MTHRLPAIEHRLLEGGCAFAKMKAAAPCTVQRSDGGASVPLGYEA